MHRREAWVGSDRACASLRPCSGARRSAAIALLIVVGVGPRAAAEPPIPLCVQPIGVAAADDIAWVQAGIVRVFGKRSIVLPRVPLSRTGWCSDNRCDSDGLVMFFHGQAFRRCARVLAMTHKPLLHLAGRAQGVAELPIFKTFYGNIVALLSTADFEQTRPERTREVIAVALHELGHTFGLRHCGDRRCVMWRGYDSAGTMDMRPLDFCGHCRNTLRSAGHQIASGPFVFWPADRFVTRAQRHAQRQAHFRPSPEIRQLLERLRTCDRRCTIESLSSSAHTFFAP